MLSQESPATDPASETVALHATDLDVLVAYAMPAPFSTRGVSEPHEKLTGL